MTEIRVIILAAAPWQINPKKLNFMYGYHQPITIPPKPKCLLHHNGIVLVHMQERLLTAFGITDIKMMVNYKKEQIQDYIDDNHLNIDTIYNPDWEDPIKSIEMGYKGAEDKDIIVLFGDVWLTDISVKALINCEDDFSTLHSPNPEGVPVGYFHAGKIRKGYMEEFIKKHREMFEEDEQLYNFQHVFYTFNSTNFVDAGLMDFDVYERTEDYLDELSIKFQKNNKIAENVIFDPNIELGENITIYENTIVGIKPINCNSTQFPIPAVIIRDNVIIGVGVVIESGDEQPTIIGENCQIGHHCIIKANVYVPPNTILADRMLVYSTKPEKVE